MWDDRISDYWATQLVRDFWPAILRAAPRPEWAPRRDLMGTPGQEREGLLMQARERYAAHVPGGWGEWESTEKERQADLAKEEAAIMATTDEELRQQYGYTPVLGCGSYGCVMATSDPLVVFKITTDESEAKFVSIVKQNGWVLPGLAQYPAIYRIPGMEHDGRPVYILWREAAAAPGIAAMVEWAKPHGIKPSDFYMAGKAIENILTLGREIRGMAIEWYREGLDPLPMVLEGYKKFKKGGGSRTSPYPSTKLYAWNLQQLNKVYEIMMDRPYLREMGITLSRLLNDHQLILADVHLDNIGITERSAPNWVIIDPGHSVPLTNIYKDIEPEPLP
jgi:hypothetical protein